MGRAVGTLLKWGWTAVSGWWEWKAPGNTQHICLTEHDPKLPRHNIQEQLRLQCITQRIARRPRQFAGMDYTTYRVLIPTCIQHFGFEQERSLLRTLLTGALWTAQRAHQCGLRASSMCPYCQGDTETEEHILWHCAAWAHVREPPITTVKRLAADLQELPAEPNCPPCLKLCGLAPPLEVFPIKGSTAAGFVPRTCALQQTARISTPPAGGPPSVEPHAVCVCYNFF